jgi:hypothetical protein
MGAKPDERRIACIAWMAPPVVAALVFAVLLHESPEYLYHWDEVQLSLGVERFDPAWHQPHPPGYYLFVLASRLAGALLPDSLEPGRVVSALAAAAFVALVGIRLPTGLAVAPRLLLLLTTALFAVACPLVGFFSLANLTYVAEGALWVWIALIVSARPRGRRLVGLALLIGVAGGVRPTLLLWSVALCGLQWLRRPDWIRARDLVPCGLALGAGLLAWLLPMLHEAGGLARYVEATGRIGAGNVWSKSAFALGPAVLLERLPRMLSDLLAAGGWALVPALARLAPGDSASRSEPVRSQQRTLLAAAGIAFGFYALVIYDSAGYALSFVLPVAGFGILETGHLARRLVDVALAVPRDLPRGVRDPRPEPSGPLRCTAALRPGHDPAGDLGRVLELRVPPRHVLPARVHDASARAGSLLRGRGRRHPLPHRAPPPRVGLGSGRRRARRPPAVPRRLPPRAARLRGALRCPPVPAR